MEKKAFKVVIEETISEEFYMYADTAENAMELAKDKYRSGEFMLAPGNLISKQMAILSPENGTTEWTEF